MLQANEAVGDLSRITFQISTASLENAAMKRSIERPGTEVAPITRAAPATPRLPASIAAAASEA